MTCEEVGKWITDHVETPLNQWFVRSRQQCTEARRWVEEIRTRVEEWRRRQETRCREQECQWLCLCCNKWFCWIVDLILRILIETIKVIEHVVEAICILIVTVIWLVVSIVVALIKWVVLAVVCIITALCSLLVLIGAVALLVALLGIVALAGPALAPLAAPFIPIAAAVAVGALFAARSLCEMNRCRVPGAIGWALKWATVAGALIALFTLSPLAALIVAIYGGLLAAYAIALEKVPCQLPTMRGLP